MNTEQADTGKMHEVIMAGDIAAVKRLIAAGDDVNQPSPHGNTPLINAALHKINQKEIFRLLLEAGADLNQKSYDNNATETIIKGDNADLVKVVLDLGLSMVCSEFNVENSPMYYAIKHGASRVVDMLIEHNADLQEYHQTFGTPLHRACRMQEPNTNIIRSLILAGADTDAMDFNDCKPNIYFSRIPNSEQAEQHYQDCIRERVALAAAASFNEASVHKIRTRSI